MRLWTLHPKYLDAAGLVALWRESLLAQKALLGETKGYTHHPQLSRFESLADSVGAIAAYLAAVHSVARDQRPPFEPVKQVSIPVRNNTTGEPLPWEPAFRNPVNRVESAFPGCFVSASLQNTGELTPPALLKQRRSWR